MADPDSTTLDGFLGRKLMLRQPARGHRAGHDAILLAASVAAKPGTRLVDLGSGVGAAGLAVARRVDGIDLVMVEIDPGLSALAASNAKNNGLTARALTADVTDFAALSAGGLGFGSADGVLMNPPFHDGARHRASPDPGRKLAHVAADATLRDWIGAAHRLLKPRGALTLIWRADGLAEILAALDATFGSIALQPVHATRGKPAVRLLIRAMKGGRAPLTLHPPAWLDGCDPEVDIAMQGEGTLPLARDR